MWLFTPIGFYSVVQDPKNKNKVAVRARFSPDLDRLREQVPALGKTLETPGRDYRFRAFAEKQAFAKGIQKLFASIDYSNFKDEVKHVSGAKTAGLYLRVWSTMSAAQRDALDRESGEAADKQRGVYHPSFLSQLGVETDDQECVECGRPILKVRGYCNNPACGLCGIEVSDASPNRHYVNAD